MILLSLALFRSNPISFYVTVCVNLLSFCVYVALADEVGVLMVIGLGMLAALPAAVIWCVGWLFMQNVLRKEFWPKRQAC